jgi:hypothetical protein
MTDRLNQKLGSVFPTRSGLKQQPFRGPPAVSTTFAARSFTQATIAGFRFGACFIAIAMWYQGRQPTEAADGSSLLSDPPATRGSATFKIMMISRDSSIFGLPQNDLRCSEWLAR